MKPQLNNVERVVRANTQTMPLPAFVTLVLVLIGLSSSVEAIEINITPVDVNNGQFVIAINEIDQIDDRVYTIESDSGLAEIRFTDGIPGAIPPSGQSNVVTTYRYGSGGVDGTIIGIYPVAQDLLPVLIPFTDFIGENNQEDVSFSLIGLASIEFEFSRVGMLVVESQPRAASEPATLVLVVLGIARIGYQRSNRLKRHKTHHRAASRSRFGGVRRCPSYVRC